MSLAPETIIKTSKTSLSLIVLAVAVLGFVLLSATRTSPTVEPAAENRFNVRGQTVTLAPLAPELSLIAEVSSAAQPTLSAAVAAEVLSLPARPGMQVEGGEILLELDDRDAQVRFSQAAADLAQAEAALRLDEAQARADQDNLKQEQRLASLSETELARLVRMKQQGHVSQTAVDQAKRNHQTALLSLAAREQAVANAPARRQQLSARLRVAEAALQAAELELERCIVRAPFAAVITATHVEPGSRVSPGQSLLSLYDTAHIELRAEVPTRHLGALRKSLDAGIAVPASTRFAGTSIELQLRRLGQDARGGTVEAWLIPQSGASTLPLGMRLPLALALPMIPDALSLPESGLYDLDKVFRIRDGRLESLKVAVHGSRQNGDQSEVVISHPDLSNGDTLLVTHLANAVTGLPVSVLSN